jgi:hypothetical protein
MTFEQGKVFVILISTQKIGQPAVALVYNMLFLHINVFTQFVNQVFKAGNALIQTGVETSAAFDPVIAAAIGKETEKPEFLFRFFLLFVFAFFFP